MTAAERWARDLAAWEIPEPILAAAPEPPWALPEELFTRRAERALETPDLDSPSYRATDGALGPGGSLLDVGSGGGAASLPFAHRTGSLGAVDSNERLLAAYVQLAGRAGARPSVWSGRWPDVAVEVPAHDVVVCHHVLYNVPDLVPFLEALTAHARRRVVVEITARHPVADLNPLWERFHGLARPERPTADDVLAVMRELGIEPAVSRWETAPNGELSAEEQVALTRRRLCLPPEREAEVAAALREIGEPPRRRVTLSWRGIA
jgi:hypothetical protein